MPIRIAPNSEFTEADKPNRIKKNALAALNSQLNGPIHVVIENGITEIGKKAFENCSQLTHVTINEGVEKIGEGAFKRCNHLTHVTIPQSVTEIERNAFARCNSLMNIKRTGEEGQDYTAVIPHGVVKIGSQAFYGCEGLHQVIVRGNISEIRYMTFFGCTNLNSFVLDSENPIIYGYKAFSGTHVQPPEDNAAITIPHFPEGNPERIYGQNIQAIADIFQPGYNDADNRIVQLFRDWMPTEYRWPPNSPKSEDITTLDFSGYSRWLKSALERNDESSCKDCITSILEWGNVAQHADVLVPELYVALCNIERKRRNNIPVSLADYLTEGQKHQQNYVYDRISTWSKILAAYMPGTFFIYDSRVALALSYLSLRLDLPCFWNIPLDQGNMLGGSFVNLNDQNVDHEGVGEENRNTVLNTINENRRRYHLIEEPEPQHRYAHNLGGACVLTSYRLYLDLLNRLADDERIRNAFLDEGFNIIRDAYHTVGFTTKQAIMAHLEKVLFMQKENPNVFQGA